MIEFSCKANEKIVVPTLNTTIEVVRIGRESVQLSIDAPPDVPIECDAGSSRTAEGYQARFMRQLCERLKKTAQGLGLLRLQLDAGMLEEVRTSLVQFRDEFQLLRYGVEGEMEAAAVKPRPKARKARRALLVEDDRNQRELLAGYLRQSGLTVDVAGDGADALDYLGTHARPDVVLLDITMKGMNGIEVLKKLREMDPAARVIIVTADIQSSTKSLTQEAGSRALIILMNSSWHVSLMASIMPR